MDKRTFGWDDPFLLGVRLTRRDLLKMAGAAGAASASLGIGSVLAACGGPSTTTTGGASGGTSTLNVGFTMPMTGSNAGIGLDELKGGLLGFDAVNKDHPFAGIDLKYHTEDSQADPRIGVSVFNKLASVENVPIIISAWSSVIYAQAPLANRAKVVLMNAGANDPKLGTLGNYVMSSYPLAYVDLTGLGNWLYMERGFRRMATIYINNASGIYGAKLISNVFQKAGGQAVASQPHEPNATDYTSQLINIRAANPDVLHMQSLLQETPLIVKQARQLGIKAQLTSYAGVSENQLILSEAGSMADGLLYTALIPPYGADVSSSQSKQISEFYNALKSTLGREPNAFPNCMYQYDTAWITGKLAEYLKTKNQAFTGENLRKAASDIKTFETPLTGTTNFLPNGTVVKPVSIKQIKNGKFVFVTQIQPNSKYMPAGQIEHPLT